MRTGVRHLVAQLEKLWPGRPLVRQAVECGVRLLAVGLHGENNVIENMIVHTAAQNAAKNAKLEQLEKPEMLRPSTDAEISHAKKRLEFARLEGDNLTIELAEAALNDLLDRYPHKEDRSAILPDKPSNPDRIRYHRSR